MAVAQAGQVDYEGLLAEHGLRPTRQRVAVLGALASRDDATAQQIHALLVDAGERVGLATVYRTLKSLSESGVVDTLCITAARRAIGYAATATTTTSSAPAAIASSSSATASSTRGWPISPPSTGSPWKRTQSRYGPLPPCQAS